MYDVPLYTEVIATSRNDVRWKGIRNMVFFSIKQINSSPSMHRLLEAFTSDVLTNQLLHAN